MRSRRSTCPLRPVSRSDAGNAGKEGRQSSPCPSDSTPAASRVRWLSACRRNQCPAGPSKRAT
ncbi:hypothetical protein OF83DRAFT_1288015, partial [Amylostereum chailletii]